MLQNPEKPPDNLTDGLDVHHGIAVPPHMSLPGQEGWRTPTVHDYEREKMDNVDEGKSTSGDEGRPSKEAVNPLSPGILLHAVAKIDHSLEKLHWRERIRHYTWTFFTMTMATGGIANVISNGMSWDNFFHMQNLTEAIVPFRFPGLYAIGAIFFLLNLVLFIVNVTMISLRFYTFPETLRASYMHPSERLFIPAAVVSFGTVLINISQYGIPKAGPWLSRAMLALFWTNAALAILASSGIYLLM
ncbi:MAG: hypothetical protein LQ350_006230 [Teloschistes chrysophthalmus]|nr:MAG: hypothetical protein LQ350_006230 [Niorma chrysophthalma]